MQNFNAKDKDQKNKITILIEERFLKQNKIEFMNIIFLLRILNSYQSKTKTVRNHKGNLFRKFNTILKQKYLVNNQNT